MAVKQFSNHGEKLWDILPENIKKAESFEDFKNKIQLSVQSM